MTDINQIIEKIGLYLELFVGLVGVFGTVSEKPLLRQKTKVRRALKSIYFKPDGVLSIIDDLSKSKKIDSERYSKVLRDFNDVEWEVARSLSQIDFNSVASNLRLSLKTANQLNAIRHGKMSVRSDIQSILNDGQNQSGKLPIGKKKALGLLSKKIKQLNKVIVQLEDKLS